MGNKKHKQKIPKIDVTGWNTSDLEEIERRRLRGQIEEFQVENTGSAHYYFSTFIISSKQDRRYYVEIRSLSEHINSCDCPDYRSNNLGTCKHIEHILFRLKKSRKRLFKKTSHTVSPYSEIFLDSRCSTICVRWPEKNNPAIRKYIDAFFSTDGTLLGNPISTYKSLHKIFSDNKKILEKSIRISRHIDYFIEHQRQQLQKKSAKELFLNDVSADKKSLDMMKYPLYSYQHEGMLHLAFNERAMLADEMGLGKTVQAIAACELLRRDKNINRVLVVATASLKAEWEEQINKFTGLSSLIIQGTRADRLRQYQSPAFFYLMNYEQVVMDGPDIQRLLSPDVVILDEAQRIKNWQTKTANAIKRLKSRYAFVLTGTPLENRIDDIYSVVQFLDPHIFGPLFRFNRDFYELDEKGRPIGYKNLDLLHQRVRPIMLRRRKNDVEGELPKRTINNYFIEMENEQRLRYEEYENKVARLVSVAKHRPLSKEELKKIQMWLACMRMLCDTPYILDSDCRISPKLNELNKIIDELLTDETTKIIIFSEWERMLQLVRELAQKKGLDFAWHTGSVPQHKRRHDINRFKQDPHCRLFLSTDSGSVGLNLQSANIVINLDLPWNPAKLEQRIARAWRKHQTRPVQVVNLVCENSIEHRMLSLLAQKQTLAQSVLEGNDSLKAMKLPSGRAAFLERMEGLIGRPLDSTKLTPSTNLRPQPDLAINPLNVNLRKSVDLLQTHHDTNKGHYTMLAVVDNTSEDIQKQLRQTFMNEAATLEMLDRHTFEIIQRLEKAGIITLNQPAKVLHTSDKLSELKKDIQEKQIKNARKHLATASHKQRMAEVLVKSDFHEEALSPLREALESTIHSFAWIIGKAENEMQTMLCHTYIKEKLIAQYGLPENTALLFTKLSGDDHVSPVPIQKLLIEHQEIYKHVDERLNNVLQT